MQSGSIGSQSYSIKQQYSNPTVKVTVGPAAEEIAPQAEIPKEKVTLAARFNTTTDALQTEDAGNGQLRSKMTIALAPQSSQAELEKLGVIFPEVEEVRSNQGLAPDGRLELVPIDGTGNPETTHILQTLEVKKEALVKDASGRAPIDSMTAQLMEEGSSVIPKGWFGVPEGTAVAPKGFEFQMATSEAGAKTESKRLRLNAISDSLGNLAQSSLAGVITLPYVSAVAPFIAVATAGPSLNRHYGDLKNAQDTLAYVENREKLSKTDMITLEIGVESSFAVSAQAEKQRLGLKVRQAKSKLASTGLLGAAGTTSVLGFAAAGGAFGTGAVAAALTTAVAATPYLAGAAMIVGSGGMVLNSLSELKSLSKEKTELEALLAKGETHTLKTIERMSPQLKRPIAIAEEQVPIQERMKTITKEQRKHRLLATAMTGGIGSIGLTVAMGTSALAIAPLALAPAGVVLAGQSISKLKELSSEKKELAELHKNGATLAPRQVERQDGSWNEEKVPISTLLSEIEKKQKTNKLILTAVGSAGAMMGLTLGAGLSMLAAAPVLLVPALLGMALFPEKVKAFAEKVVGFIGGKFGEAGRSRKELIKDSEAQTEATKEALIKDLDGVAKSNPELFYVPTDKEIDAAKKSGEAPPRGYFSQLNLLMGEYASAGSRLARAQIMQQIEGLLGQAPPEAQASIPGVTERLRDLHISTEAGWIARDVMLEMKKDTTQSVIEDDRVQARLGELGYGTDNIEQQYEESLTLEHSPEKIQGLLNKSAAGDRDASLELARKEIFGAGRLYYQSREELGSYVFTDLVDALARPQDEENLETVIKEVNYQLDRPMAPSTGADKDEKWWLGESTVGLDTGLNEPLRLVDFTNLKNAITTLEKPLDLTKATLTPDNSAGTLNDAQSRMASAFRALHDVDKSSAEKLGKAFATLNNPSEFEGLNPQEAQQKKLQAGLDLTEAKAKLQEKAPEMVALWDKARVDTEEDFFQRSMDHDFAREVLARPEVTEAAQRLGIAPEGAKALYTGLMRSHLMGDPRALQSQMVDASGKEVDPAKSELLQVIDQTMVALAAQRSQGANDTVLQEATLGNPDADPQVAAFLQANPAVGELLASDKLVTLANEMQASPEEVRTAYLTLVQANLSPVLTAEFDGKYSAGDMQTVKTFEIGSRVGQLVQSSLRPSAEVVAQQVEAGMSGPVVNSVLNHPDIKAMGEQLKVDTAALMRTLLAADLAGDKTPLDALAVRAQKGDAQAQSELQMIQTLAQATIEFAAQANAQQTQAPIAA